MKKILSLFLALTLTMGANSLASCGKKNDNSVPPITSDSEPEVNTFTVTFKQFNQVDIVETVEEGQDLTNIPAPKARTGYNVAWDTSADSLKNVTKNITVTAVYTAKTYTVTYDANGGNVATASFKATYDEEFTLATPTRDGYRFVCWTYNGNKVDDSSKWNIDAESIILVASWIEVTKYTVTFKQDGQEDQAIKVEEGKAADISQIKAPAPITGYDVAWEKKDLTNVTSDITVGVVKTAKTYTVTYDANGGTVTPASFTATYDAEFTLAEPTRDGYKFTGWTYDNKAVTATKWNIDAENITLVAGWEEVVVNQYTVTFKQDGQEDQTIKVKEGETADISQIKAPAPITGYDVAWEKKDLTNVTSDITVGVVKTAKTYTVTYDANGGTVTPASFTATYDAEFTLAEPTRDGYKFTGWTYDNKAVTATKWNIDAENITLVAGWEALTIYTIVFVQKGQPEKEFKIEAGQTFTNTPEVVAVVGYNIKWNEAELAQLQGAITSNVVVNAVVEAKSYTVSLVAVANGSVTQTSYTFTYGEDYNLEAFATPNAGYKLKDWKLGETSIPTIGNWEIDQMDLTLTANFVVKTYTITLDPTDGTLPDGQRTITLTYGEAYELPKPTSASGSSGDSFQGWYYGSIEINNSGTWEYNFEENITLSAKWFEMWTSNY